MLKMGCGTSALVDDSINVWVDIFEDCANLLNFLISTEHIPTFIGTA